MATANPDGTIRAIDNGWARLRSVAHRWRAHLVRKYGERAFVEFRREFREKALEDGYGQEQIAEDLRGAAT